MKYTLESRLDRWGLMFFALVASAVIVKRIFFPDFDIREIMRPCVFYTATGYFCPGCGGTRSVIALLNGRFLVSAVDFPMVMYCALVYAWFMVSHTIDRLSRHRIPIGMKYSHRWIYGSLVVVAVHCVLKNLFYIKTGILPFL